MAAQRRRLSAHLPRRSSLGPHGRQEIRVAKAAELEKEHQRRKSAKMSFLDPRLLALRYLRYIVAGEVAGAWKNFGGRGAALTNLAHFLGPPLIPNVETASKFEKAQSTARAHLAWGEGTCGRSGEI